MTSQIRNMELNDKTAVFESQIVELERQLKGLKDQVNIQLMEYIGGQVANVYSKMDTVVETFHNVEELFKQDTKKLSREKSDLILRVDKFVDSVADLQAKFGKQDETFKNLLKILQCALEIENVQYSLDVQDDKDKQQMSLYAGTTTSSGATQTTVDSFSPKKN